MRDDPTIRVEAVAGIIDEIRHLLSLGPVNRSVLANVLSALKKLAARSELWGASAFAAPAVGEYQARYLIHEDPESNMALYLNVMRPGKKISPHNHTTWACIAGVEGVEINTTFNRTDDGSVPGIGVLEQSAVIPVGPGDGIALLADDIHSVRIEGQEPIRHLHLYGKPLETLTGRLSFDIESNTVKTMDIGVTTIR